MACCPMPEREEFVIHLVLGERGPRISRVVDNLIGHMDASDLDSLTVDASELELADIEGAVRTPPFLAPSRKVVLSNAPVSGSAATKFWEWLAALGKSPPDRAEIAVVFFLDGLNRSERRAFEQRAQKLGSGNFNVQILRELKRSSRDTSALQWIREVVADQGLEIDGRAAAFLRQRSTLDAGALEQEIKKIAALKNFAGRITEDDIRSADPHPAEQAVWDFLDAVIERHTGTALRVLASVISQGEPPELVLALLARTMPRLIMSKALTTSGVPPDQWASRLGVRDWQARKLGEQSSSFDMIDLKRMLAAIVDLDLRYKSGRLEYGGLIAGLEALTVRFCYRAFDQEATATTA